MFKKSKEVEVEELEGGMRRKILATAGKLMMVQVTFERTETGGGLHSHPHEQVSYIAKGKFEITVEGEQAVLEKGDSFYAGSGESHGAQALEEGSVIVDVFTPQREDMLEG